ncbi:hypothetical protein SAMN05892877_103382 [Rhizobium subbaraonis]|uniref:Uncharacterized protein n=1 Tax=Rhizobium subbaraonis TaxID=908946 RepID=A0A285U6L9_9HYPH|nr:hypothetical protein [Rhizobium subbaraonis]SOC37038.1 hypothetical protein SAMN05892877_103382 [Rhizobium subbaraonis]
MANRILPNGTVIVEERTPAEEKEFLEFYAAVLEREAGARISRQPDFAATLQAWADKASAKAAAINTRPAQGDLFGDPH